MKLAKDIANRYITSVTLKFDWASQTWKAKAWACGERHAVLVKVSDDREFDTADKALRELERVLGQQETEEDDE